MATILARVQPHVTVCRLANVVRVYVPVGRTGDIRATAGFRLTANTQALGLQVSASDLWLAGQSNQSINIPLQEAEGVSLDAPGLPLPTSLVQFVSDCSLEGLPARQTEVVMLHGPPSQAIDTTVLATLCWRLRPNQPAGEYIGHVNLSAFVVPEAEQ